MIPPVPSVLAVALQNLGEIISEETNAHKAFYFDRLRIALEVIRRDWDNAAAARVEEIDELLALLRKGVEIAPAEHRAVLVDTLTKAENGNNALKISALDEKANQLLTGLIAMQSWLEETATKEAQALLTEVWSFLKRYAQRHAFIDYMW